MEKMYERLKNRKDNGEVLSLSILDNILLQQLWWEESVPDQYIAELFNTTKENIKKLRYKYNIKPANCALVNALRNI